MPPFFSNDIWLADGGAEFVRDGDVVVSVGAKSGTTWMCYCAHALRTKGAQGDEAEALGFKPYVDIMASTPWLDLVHFPGQTGAQRADHYRHGTLADGSRLRDYWDNPAHPFRVFKSHMSPSSWTEGNPVANVLPVTQRPLVKYVSVVRRGLDVGVSLKHFFLRHRTEFQTMWGGSPPHYASVDDSVMDLLPGGNLYSLYFQYVKSWWHLRNAPNVLLMHYSDMILDHAALITKLAAFYGVDLAVPEFDRVANMCSSAHMKQNVELFDYILPVGTPSNSIMNGGSFIRQKDKNASASDTVSPGVLAAWNRALVSEFDDIELRTWADNGGAFS